MTSPTKIYTGKVVISNEQAQALWGLQQTGRLSVTLPVPVIEFAFKNRFEFKYHPNFGAWTEVNQIELVEAENAAL